MKRCPICDKTFADGMKFCQTDGTLLIDDAPPADPYKTVVGNQSDISSAIPPVDPFKTMVASPPPKPSNEDVLDLPEENIDSLKTMVVTPEELKADKGDVPKLDLPPPVPIIEPKVATPTDSPKSNEPSLSPPNFGDLSSSSESGLPKPSEPIQSSSDDASSSKSNLPSPFDSKAKPIDFSTEAPPYGNQENKPIPSPFDGSMIGYQPPSAPPPFDSPKPVEKEPEPMYGGQQDESPNQSPFQPPSPFGSPEPYNQPMQQSDWTPPPAPVSEWGNQDLGANTPFQPPPAAGGQDQTLAIVSLVCGILGIVCCQIAGPVAIITGFMAKKKATENPSQFGGSGMALAGIITGAIGTLLLIGVILYYIIVIALVASQ